MNEVFTIAGIGIVSTSFVLILKQYRPEFAFAAALAAGIFIFGYAVLTSSEIFEHAKNLVDISGIDSEKYAVLFRCFGISIVTKIASETCKDCGQGSISSKIDFAGKITILLTAVPLYSEIIGIIKNLINL